MTPEEIEARQRILEAVIGLLSEVDDSTQITIREIAKRAGVGIGLINYHFQSRENLIQQAVASLTGDLADQWETMLDHSIADPVERLKSLLNVNATVAMQNAKYARILIQHELLEGDFSVPLVIVPVLREIFGQAKTEQELRSLAFLLVTGLQVAFIRQQAFRRFTGVNPANDAQRTDWIDQMVDQLIK